MHLSMWFVNRDILKAFDLLFQWALHTESWIPFNDYNSYMIIFVFCLVDSGSWFQQTMDSKKPNKISAPSTPSNQSRCNSFSAFIWGIIWTDWSQMNYQFIHTRIFYLFQPWYKQRNRSWQHPLLGRWAVADEAAG